MDLIDNGTTRALTWGGKRRPYGHLPTTTTVSKRHRIGFEYNAADDKLHCMYAQVRGMKPWQMMLQFGQPTSGGGGGGGERRTIGGYITDTPWRFTQRSPKGVPRNGRRRNQAVGGTADKRAIQRCLLHG